MERLSPAKLRLLFPAVKRASYLNAAAASPLATPVEKAAVDQLREAAEWGDIGYSVWVKRRGEVRAALARFLGARPDELAFVQSTSMGFNVVADCWRQRGIKEVVTFEDEFPSTTLPLLHHGFTLRFVAPRPDGRYALEDVERALTRRTGALAVSAVQFGSGLRMDLPGLSRLCRARGLRFAVNAAQGLGQVALDVGALRPDFLCGTSHKWMMGGYGVGLLYASGRALAGMKLPFAGWQSVDEPMRMDNRVGAAVTQRRGIRVARGARVRHDASALEAGNYAYAPLFSLGAALELFARLGMRAVEAHNAGLQSTLRARLLRAGFRATAPDEPKLRAGICVFKVDGDPGAVARELAKKGVRVSRRGGGIRVSTHAFNAEEDLEQLFWAMQRVGVQPP
jgi:selenocysteine lyase/cysteine desulfurase